MRVCNQTGDAFRSTGTCEHPRPLESATLTFSILGELLESLIQNPLNGALSDAEVACAKTLVKPSYALFPEYMLDHS